LDKNAIVLAVEAFENANRDEAIQLLRQASISKVLDARSIELIGTAYIEYGERDLAIDFIGSAANQYGESAEIYDVIGKLARRMRLPSIVEKAYRQAVQIKNDEPRYYQFLTMAMAENGRSDEAIALLQSVIPYFPDNADLWNLVGSILEQNRNDLQNSLIMYEQAVELDPKHVSALCNLARRVQYSDVDAADIYYKRAIAAQPNNSVIRTHYGIFLMGLGRLTEAWPYYEGRLGPNTGEFSVSMQDHELPEWDGDALADKTIFVTGEQGLGDEILFLVHIRALMDQGCTVCIGCDPRLVGPLQAGLPGVKVYAYENTYKRGYKTRTYPQFEADRKAGIITPDCAVNSGSLMKFFWPTLADIRPVGHGWLKATDAKAREVADKICGLSDKPLIGLSWRSGNIQGGRKFYYPSIDAHAILQDVKGVRFICMQYSHTEEEIRALRDVGIDIHVIPDLDLREDLDGNLAIMEHLDVVIGPSTATQILSIAGGFQTWVLSHGLPWWDFGVAEDKPRMFSNAHWIQRHSNDLNWHDVYGRIRDRLLARYG